MVLAAYAQGVFPMGEPDGTIAWYQPHKRGILPVKEFHVPRRLAKWMRHTSLSVTMNCDFDAVLWGCSSVDRGAEREKTWITLPIQEIYGELHRYGFAHSIEVWNGTQLVGGLYGVALRGLFAGESMFSRETNASKLALVACAAWLQAMGFELWDTQFYTPHLGQFGCIEISQTAYEARLRRALTASHMPFSPYKFS